MFDKYHPGYFGKASCGAGMWCKIVQSGRNFVGVSISHSMCILYSAKLTGVVTLPVLLQVGMRYFNKRTNKYHSPIVNLDKLWTLVGDEVRTSSSPAPTASNTVVARPSKQVQHGLMQLLGCADLAAVAHLPGTGGSSEGHQQGRRD